MTYAKFTKKEACHYLRHLGGKIGSAREFIASEIGYLCDDLDYEDGDEPRDEIDAFTDLESMDRIWDVPANRVAYRKINRELGFERQVVEGEHITIFSGGGSRILRVGEWIDEGINLKEELEVSP